MTETPSDVGDQLYTRIKRLIIEKRDWSQAKDLLEAKLEKDELTLSDMVDANNYSLLYVLCEKAQASAFYDDGCGEKQMERKTMLQLASLILKISQKDHMDCIHNRQKDGNTPLLRCLNGYYDGSCNELIELLIDFYHSHMGAEFPNYLSLQNDFGFTIFHYFANGHIPLHICRRLFDKSSQSLQNLLIIPDKYFRETPLHHIASIAFDEDDEDLQFSYKNLLQLFAQRCPYANLVYNDEGQLPIDKLLSSFIDCEPFDMSDIIQSVPDTGIDTEKDLDRPLQYCQKRKYCLTNFLETSILYNLWYQIDVFLRTASTYQMVHQQKLELEEDFSSVHFAASCPSFPIIALRCAVRKYPNAVRKPTKSSGLLPLHIAAMFSAMYPKQPSDRDTYKANEFPSTRPPVERPRVEFSRWKNCRLQRQRLESHCRHTHTDESESIFCNFSLIEYLLKLNSDAANVETNDRRLPLHLACVYGASWYDVQLLLNVAPDSIACLDVQTKLYPFMLAAVRNDDINSLNVIFNLLLMSPELARTSHHFGNEQV